MAKTPIAPWLSDEGRVTEAMVLPLVSGRVAAKTYVLTGSFPVVWLRYGAVATIALPKFGAAAARRQGPVAEASVGVPTSTPSV